MDPLPPLAPASAEAVADAERRLGHRLPPLLRRLYREVANGGFGPGYGILGVAGGHPDDLGMTAANLLDPQEFPGLFRSPTGDAPFTRTSTVLPHRQ